MEPGITLRNQWRNSAGHQAIRSFQNGNPLSFFPCYCGKFQPDESTTDYNHILGRLECLANPGAVLESAQAEHPLQIGSGQRPHTGTGRNRQPVIRQAAAVAKVQCFSNRVNALNANTGTQGDIFACQHLGAAHGQLLNRGLTQQISL